jgi:prefoldin subunit 5
MARRLFPLLALTAAMALLWILMERTFVAIGDGLETAVEVSAVSADAATSVEELSTGLVTLIESVDSLGANAQALSNDAATAADSVSDAASGSVGDSLRTLSRTAGRLAPVVGFVEGLSGSRGAAKDLESLSASLKPLPAELDKIAADLSATSKSLRATGQALDTVRDDLTATKATVSKGQAALSKLPPAAARTQQTAQARLDRLDTNLWLWRAALVALWVMGALMVMRRPRTCEAEPIGV